MLERYDNRLIMNDKQINELAEDDIDFDDDDEFMREYRAKRVNQLQEMAARPKFGSVYEIRKPEWEQEIVRAPTDVNVFIVLYQPQ